MLTAAACGAGEAPPAGDVNVYVFPESVPDSVFAAFTAETGVKVHTTTYESNEELVAGLHARPGSYDLVMPSDYTVDVLIQEGALRPLDLAKLPNYNNISPAFLSPWFDPGGIAQSARGRGKHEKFSLPWLWGTTGIAWNDSVVNPPPEKWADLWNPAWAGKVVLPDDSRELLGIALLASGYSKNDTDPAHLAVAKEKAIALAKTAVALDANNPEQYLADGRAVIGAVFNGNAELAHRQNPNVRYAFPTDGPGIWFDNLAIPARAAHPQNAEALIDFLLRPESGADVIQAYPFSSPNQAAVDRLKEMNPPAWTAYSTDPITNPGPEILSGAQPVKNIGPANSERFEAAWAEVVAARGGTP